MKIYFAHSTNLNYVPIYTALQKSLGKSHELILPHADKVVKSKEIIEKCDLVIGEVSHPCIGMGIELGWASASDVLIICVYKKGTKVSNSLKFICKTFIEYENETQLSEKLAAEIKKLDFF